MKRAPDQSSATDSMDMHLHPEHAARCNHSALRPNVTLLSAASFSWRIHPDDAAAFRDCAINGQLRVAWHAAAELPDLGDYRTPSFRDNWALRITGYITAPTTDAYFIRVRANDAFVLRLDGEEVASGEIVNRYSDTPCVWRRGR